MKRWFSTDGRWQFEFYWQRVGYCHAKNAAPHWRLTEIGVWIWLRLPRFEVNTFPHWCWKYDPRRRRGTKIQFRIWKWAQPHTGYASKWLEIMFWLPLNFGRL